MARIEESCRADEKNDEASAEKNYERSRKNEPMALKIAAKVLHHTELHSYPRVRTTKWPNGKTAKRTKSEILQHNK
jgi:hypothetical protein